MFEDIETHKKLSKWIIGTFTACILIYLGIRHISHVADAVMWLKDLLNPLLIGLILALFLNVPLGVIERHLFPKHPTSRKTKMRRPLAGCNSETICGGKHSQPGQKYGYNRNLYYSQCFRSCYLSPRLPKTHLQMNVYKSGSYQFLILRVKFL